MKNIENTKSNIKNILLALLVSLVAIVLAIAIITTITGRETNKVQATTIESPDVLEIQEEEIIELLLDNNVKIPEEFLEDPLLSEFVADIITAITNNPNAVFSVNNHIAVNFIESIREVVNKQNGIYKNRQTSATPFHALRDNVLYGPWQPEWEFFNCYAYAIGRTELP